MNNLKLKDIPCPEIYKSSADFRFFLKWFNTALEKTQYDLENLIDLYDPLRCPEDLVWCLADTMGYKFDDRLPTSFNRLVLLYFMSMIYNRGSRNGMILAGETNLAQFVIQQDAEKNPILYNRLENTSIPTNAVSVTSHVDEGYIDVVYFSTKLPKDACVEYVRPLGMFTFQRAGVEFSANTKISVDAELTNLQNTGMTFGPTQVGHYRRADYASLQKMTEQANYLHYDGVHGEMELIEGQVDETATRQPVWGRNSVYEETTNPNINPGYRALCSLQLSNNEHIMQALIDPIFTLGYQPQDAGHMSMPDDYYTVHESKQYNLRYDITTDEQYTRTDADNDYIISTIDKDRSPNLDKGKPTPMPAVNPVMAKLGDAISISDDNSEYLDDN